jgi:hypothetical protein
MRVGWLKIERGSCHHISVFDQGGASDFKMNTVIVNTGYCKPSDNQEQKIVPLSEFFTVPIQTSAQVMAFSAEGGGTVLNIGDTALILKYIKIRPPRPCRIGYGQRSGGRMILNHRRPRARRVTPAVHRRIAHSTWQTISIGKIM